jgi:hypothetical protein
MRHTAFFAALCWSAASLAEDQEPIACQVKALSGVEHRQHEAATTRLLSQVVEVKALPSGYAWRLPASAMSDAPLWVEREQKCCPFLLLTLRFQPRNAELWIDAASSDPRAVAFLRDTFIARLAKRQVPGTEGWSPQQR